MKSHIISFYNYMDIPFEPVTEIMEKEDMETELKTVIKTELLLHKKYEEVLKAGKGDIVFVSLNSELPRFNKEGIGINAGLGMFSKELEDALIGHAVGDKFFVSVQEKEVQVEIKGCKRLTVPELSDDFVKSLKLDGITDVNGYKKYLADEKLNMYSEAYTEMYASDLFEQTCEKSRWEIDPEEKEQFYRLWSRHQKEDNDFHGMSFYENYEGELEEMERNDSFFLMRIIMTYLLFCGTDYRSIEADGIDFGNIEKITEMKNTVLNPFKNYLKDKVRVIAG